MLIGRDFLYSIIFLRFALATVILIINTTLFGLAHTQVYFLISTIYILTILYSLMALVKFSNTAFLYLQIILDLVIETLLIHYTGGVDSVLVLLLPLSTIAAGIVISGRAAIMIALMGSAMYAGIVSLEFWGIIPLPEGFLNDLNHEGSYVFALLYFRVTVFCIIGFLSAYISEQLSRKDKVLISLQEKLRREDRLYAIGKLAANTAHEIRNPLASISGCVEALNESLVLEGNNEKLFKLIMKETTRLNDIINGLLEYVKPRRLQLERVNISKILDEVIFLIKSSKDFKKDILIKKEGQENGLSVICDPQQIKQVFFNLLINAVEAVDENGRIVITQEVNSDKGQIVISFSDNGEGISPDRMESLFEPFSSGKDTGVGLGLAIVLSIIEEHKGNINVETKKGKGTKFSVCLPLNEKNTGESDAGKDTFS
ncbi:MAG: ATP-binding protein [Candidatus Omnitrophota bacterium]